MPENNNPIYARLPNIFSVPISAANTKSDGAGTIATDIFKAFTAGLNGAWLTKIKLNPTATAAATNTTATVIRIFISSKTSGVTTSADTYLVQEVSVAAQSADHSTNATFGIEILLGFAIPPSWTVLVTSHAAPAANTAWQATVYGGDY